MLDHLDGAEYSSASECWVEAVKSICKRKKNKNKRRFSEEQIRSLEVMFESDTKLEPRKKAQLANDLGLQPRQIAIWFQNRRARWKSKQIEKDYRILLANYNILASHFDSLKKENQSLLIQLQQLKHEMSGKPEKRNHCQIFQETAAGQQGSSDGESDYTKMDLEVKNIPSISKPLEGDSSIKAELLALDEENEMLKKAVDTTSLTSSEDWGSLDSDDLINQPSCHWWDFWG